MLRLCEVKVKLLLTLLLYVANTGNHHAPVRQNLLRVSFLQNRRKFIPVVPGLAQQGRVPYFKRYN
jgi:hypothetical protein